VKEVPGLALLALAGLACATARAPIEVSDSTGLGRSFFVRQKITARFGDETRRLETALESSCGELRLVALTPFGLRLFSAVQRGSEIEVEAFAGAALPFSPEHVVRDIERTFFRSPPPASPDAERPVRRGDERIDETWQQGRLRSRAIRPADDAASEPVVIDYRGAFLLDGVPERVELANPRFGYRLEIENFAAVEVPCESEARSGDVDAP
jgi:hypothetical protein